MGGIIANSCRAKALEIAGTYTVRDGDRSHSAQQDNVFSEENTCINFVMTVSE